MTNEDFKLIFVKQTQAFTELENWKDGSKREELKKEIVEFIVKTEKECIEAFMVGRAKVSAARSLLSDVESQEMLDRRLKESKITYTTLGMNPENDIALEGRGSTKAQKVKEKETRLWIPAVQACRKIKGISDEKILSMLRPSYPRLTIEMIGEVK